MTRLAFLSADGVALVSPLRDARKHRRVVDVSALGKLELRGDLAGVAPTPGEELVPIAPRRALLVTDDPRAARERLAGGPARVYDMTSALAALEVEGEDLMRRATALDLDALPAVGAILRATPALVERRGGERFRLVVPQELARFVADTLVDLAEGLDG